MSNTSLAKKLLAVQQEVEAITKDKTNPHFKSKFADINGYIDVLKPLLNKHGMVCIQPLTHINGQPAIRTILMECETGETIEDITPITPMTEEVVESLNSKGAKVVSKSFDAQRQGSAVTYFRRYALKSMLFLQEEDDDGNQASGKTSYPERTVDTTPDFDL